MDIDNILKLLWLLQSITTTCMNRLNFINTKYFIFFEHEDQIWSYSLSPSLCEYIIMYRLHAVSDRRYLPPYIWPDTNISKHLTYLVCMVDYI